MIWKRTEGVTGREGKGCGREGEYCGKSGERGLRIEGEGE